MSPYCSVVQVMLGLHLCGNPLLPHWQWGLESVLPCFCWVGSHHCLEDLEINTLSWKFTDHSSGIRTPSLWEQLTVGNSSSFSSSIPTELICLPCGWLLLLFHPCMEDVASQDFIWAPQPHPGPLSLLKPEAPLAPRLEAPLEEVKCRLSCALDLFSFCMFIQGTLLSRVQLCIWKADC